MSRQIIDGDGNKRFDTRVHIRDRKGTIVDVRPYSLKCVGDTQYYIDKKTKKVYSADGEELKSKPQPVQVGVPAQPKAKTPVVPAQTPVQTKPVQTAPDPAKPGLMGRLFGQHDAPPPQDAPATDAEAIAAGLMADPANPEDENPEPTLTDPALNPDL